MIVKTPCRFCASRCGLLLNLKGKRIISIKGDPTDPVSRGWSCARGRAATAGQQTKHHGPVTPRLK